MAVRQTIDLPVKFIGVGEGIEDLQPFDADTFVESLFKAAGGVLIEVNARVEEALVEAIQQNYEDWQPNISQNVDGRSPACRSGETFMAGIDFEELIMITLLNISSLHQRTRRSRSWNFGRR